MDGLGICEIPDVLRVISFIKILINVVKFMVPMGLIVMVSLDIGKGVISGENDIVKILKASGNRILAAVIIFLLPTIVNFVLVFIDANTSYESCWANAESSIIEEYQVLWDEAFENKKKEEEATNNKFKNPEYTEENSHTNSINGIKYILYNQCDTRWGDFPFLNNTICGSGCAMTSDAVVASAYDANITPYTVYNSSYKTNWPSITVPYFTDDNFSCTRGWQLSTAQVVSEMLKGNVFIIRVNAESHFTSSQHYIALIDISSDGSKIFVGNSYDSGKGNYNRNGWFDIDDVFIDQREYHLCIPSEYLLDKFN